MDNSLRYFGCAAGFAFGLVWMTVGLGSAILCLLLAAFGYGVVFVAGRARAEGIARRLVIRRTNALAESLDGLDLDHYEPVYERPDDSTSPLAAEADYGWPLETPEIAQTEAR
ncbi:MAG TPA: hypothetical protein VE984_05000 [Gaiellaceae bacterium]|nr:hypothetical protein [Gaiellaceae bacterium]